MAGVMHVSKGVMRVEPGTRVGQYLSFEAESLHSYDGDYVSENNTIKNTRIDCMKWTIDKQVDWCYGHRVHNQTLNAEYTGSEGTCLACRHNHGHQGKIKVMLEGDVLTRGMVVDFKMMGWFKDFIDDTLDHKFIMDINDPLVSHEVPEYCTKEGIIDVGMLLPQAEGHFVPDMSKLDLTSYTGSVGTAIFEKYEGMVFVDFVPTSENLSAWLLRVANDKMQQIGVNVVAVDCWETPKSHCRVDV